MHPVAGRVECPRGCNDPKWQRVIHPAFLQHIRKLAEHMGMDREKNRSFSRDFEDLANSYLGPPIPHFVLINKPKKTP